MMFSGLALITTVLYSLHGLLQGTTDALERVMNGRVRRVDADCNSPYPCIPQPCCHGMVKEVPAGAHHHPEPSISTIASNGAEIGPHEWLSSGEHDNRSPDIPYLVDHPQSLTLESTPAASFSPALTSSWCTSGDTGA